MFMNKILRLVDAKSLTDLDESMHRAVVRILNNHITQYTLYPTSAQYNIACSSLVHHFPQLQDRVVFFGTEKNVLYQIWLSSLKTKFKAARQKLTADAEVLAARAKTELNAGN